MTIDSNLKIFPFYQKITYEEREKHDYETGLQKLWSGMIEEDCLDVEAINKQLDRKTFIGKKDIKDQ